MKKEDPFGGRVPEELRNPIELTREEYDRIFLEGSPEDEEVKKMMETKGIRADEGIIPIIVDGQKQFVDTGRDWGVRIDMHDEDTVSQIAKENNPPPSKN